MTPRGWGRRLVWTQVAVLLIMSLTVVVTAIVVGPRLFDTHMRQAGHSEPMALDHAEQAFRDAGSVSLLVGLGVALVLAGILSWLLNRRLARGLDALSEGSARVSRGDYDVPVRMPAVGAELEEVGDRFNQMAAQIEETEVTRRRMLADLGHELRTPLAATQVTLEGLQDGMVDYSPATLDILVRQNARLTALANDISAVSRAEAGQIALHRRPIAIDDLVADSAEVWRRSCEAAGVRLSTDMTSGAVVDADAVRLGQVLDNLLRNALQHTSERDLIGVRTRRDGDAVGVTVSDTGAGIRPEAMPHLFERFYHDGRARTRDVDGGTGVGLTVSRAIAEAHGGSLDAASAGPGSGATFTLRLPVAADTYTDDTNADADTDA